MNQEKDTKGIERQPRAYIHKVDPRMGVFARPARHDIGLVLLIDPPKSIEQEQQPEPLIQTEIPSATTPEEKMLVDNLSERIFGYFTALRQALFNILT